MNKRVVAVMESNEDEIVLFGRGQYVGDEPCPLLGDFLNPKIVLDNGGVVWGCQCWWMSEDEYTKYKQDNYDVPPKERVVQLPA